MPSRKQSRDLLGCKKVRQLPAGSGRSARVGVLAPLPGVGHFPAPPEPSPAATKAPTQAASLDQPGNLEPLPGADPGAAVASAAEDDSPNRIVWLMYRVRIEVGLSE